MRDIIIIGPKKTATTSLYHAINRVVGDSHQIIAKESNLFLRKPASEIAQSYKKPIIDISPEYYTSFRSIINIREFSRYRKSSPVIICLSRNNIQRSESHYRYMYSKGIVSKDLLEQEVETICLSELDIWQTYSGLNVMKVDLTSAVVILEGELGAKLNLQVENSGDFVPRSKLVHSILKYFNTLMTNIFPKNRLRIYIADKLGYLIYKKSKETTIIQVPKKLNLILETIRKNT